MAQKLEEEIEDSHGHERKSSAMLKACATLKKTVSMSQVLIKDFFLLCSS